MYDALLGLKMADTSAARKLMARKRPSKKEQERSNDGRIHNWSTSQRAKDQLEVMQHQLVLKNQTKQRSNTEVQEPILQKMEAVCMPPTTN